LSVLYGATTITKIKKSKHTLSLTTSEKKKTSRRLEKIANDIKLAEKDIVYLENKIDKLSRNKIETEQTYEILKKELKGFEKDFETTSALLEKKRKTFVFLLSEQFSIVFAIEQAHEATKESVVLHEVYHAYKKQNTQALASLRKDILTLKKRKKLKLYLRNKTKSKIAYIIKKREEYAQQKLVKEKLLKKLSMDEEKYNAKLEKLVDKQNSLRSTLAKLNILHKQEVEEARRRAAAKKEAMRLEKERQRKIRKAKALAREKARRAKEALQRAKTEEERVAARLAIKEAKKENERVYKESDRVRQINSSYTKSQTYKYRGAKTISPLAHARVIKKFGTYIDPIYKIKIFNESITLKSKIPDAKVKNVLNGKVVFAGKSSMLGKVVVVAHSYKMHTVYAGLSKIAPTIHVGSKIKKGYVVGKVNQKLIFQATKDSKHIDPLKLIRI
jgi:murein DD-endopeptidase MepM/ murein hydrolase activator NlpD